MTKSIFFRKKFLLGLCMVLLPILVYSLVKTVFNLNQKSLSENVFAEQSSQENEVPESTQVTESNAFVVAIDPGHGGKDPGTNGNGLIEKEVTLDICLRLNEILHSKGIKTYMVRSDDTFINRKIRIANANEQNVDLYLSLHCDWYEDSVYNGTQTFYKDSETLKAGNLIEKDYAETIHNTLVNAIGTTNRGVIPDNGLSVIQRAEMPSILIEIGFLSNKKDADRLKTDSFRQTAAEALAEGIEKAFAKIGP